MSPENPQSSADAGFPSTASIVPFLRGPASDAFPLVIRRDGQVSPLHAVNDLCGEDILASLSQATQPLLAAALRQHRHTGARNALTLLVPPRAAPDTNRENDVVTAFLASGPWIGAALAWEPCATIELCYRALAFVLADEHASIRVDIVDKVGSDRILAAQTDGIDVIMAHRGDDSQLRLALAGLAQQTHRCQTILCFDQSPDPTLIEHLRNQDRLDLFEVLPNPAGPYVPRQHFGLTSAGKYIAFQDSDDFPLPSRIEKLIDLADSAAADIVGSHELRCDELKRTVEAIRYPLDVNHALSLSEGSVQLFATTIMRSDLFRRIGGFSTIRSFGADRQLQLRAYAHARIRNIDAFLYIRRRRAGALTTSASTGMGSLVRQQVNLAMDEAFRGMKAGRPDAAQTALAVECTQEKFVIKNLRTGSAEPARLRAEMNLR